jgi:HSP20 family protein
MLMRFDPLRELDRVAQALTQQAGALRQSTMPMDAYRDGDRFVVAFDLPGVDAEAIDLTVERNVLTVRAERNWQPAEGQEVLVAERPQGVFSRQLFLGDSLDPERLTASYERGVLTLTVPVAEQAKPRKVSITSGSDGQSAPALSGASTGDGTSGGTGSA